MSEARDNTVDEPSPPEAPTSIMDSDSDNDSDSDSDSDSGDDWVGPERTQKPPLYCANEQCDQRFSNRVPIVLFAGCGHTVYCVKCARAPAKASAEPMCPICDYPFPDFYEVDYNCTPQPE